MDKPIQQAHGMKILPDQKATSSDSTSARDAVWLRGIMPVLLRITLTLLLFSAASLHAEPPKAKHNNTGVFDQLNFGDNREQVLAKLKASKFVELTVQETFIGRTGLNGIFRTRKKIDGFDAMLSFDWTEEGGLKEITLQTTPLSGNDVEARLTPCWKEFIALLTSLHGQPIHEHGNLRIASIQDGSMSATHLWKLEQGGTAMLGASREGDDYHIAVRFTTKEIKPVVIHAP